MGAISQRVHLVYDEAPDAITLPDDGVLTGNLAKLICCDTCYPSKSMMARRGTMAAVPTAKRY
jgi:hypothetical protein